MFKAIPVNHPRSSTPSPHPDPLILDGKKILIIVIILYQGE